MNNEIFSQNLRRLRLQKKLTQEQLASILGVSIQSVSRWECGNSLPDVMLLPEIARVYGVTVDDLYRAEVNGYASYAQRLLAVYEASGRSEDFLEAEREFLRMEAPTPDDLRSWGVLYHYMTQQCAALARKKLEQAMAHPAVSEQVYCSAALQKNALLRDLGQGRQEAERYEAALKAHPEDPRLWVLASACNLLIGEDSRALSQAEEGLRRFPERSILHIHAGDALRNLKRYGEAFSHWEKALELDSGFLDARYSMAFCHEELGQYDRAYRIWTEIVRELDRRGLAAEREYPAEMAENCLQKMR